MAEEHENNAADLEAKRRKIRKGTKSCWECKRRKMKCMYTDSPSDHDAVCMGCQRRGTKCVGQEFQMEETFVRPKRKRSQETNSQDQFVRLEGLVKQLMKKVAGDDVPVDGEAHTNSDPDGYTTNNHDILTPASTDSDSSRFLNFYKPSEDFGHGKNDKLSQQLYESLPMKEDLEIICKAHNNGSTLSHEMLTIPYKILKQKGIKMAENLLEMPGPDSHPVLTARYMLTVATFLQHIPPRLHIAGLSESPRAIMERLSGTAINLVTTNDELLGSIEGLECILLESVFQANGGNLRRSWVANRRAMVIAQLMNLHRNGSQILYKVLDSRTRVYPQYIWFRIVYHDRHLCLLLNLTQGFSDQGVATGEIFTDDIPMGRLEVTHSTIASRILERNESGPDARNYPLTETLDMELQKAASNLPSNFWLIPNLASVAHDPRASFWEMGRLLNQLFHYNLLNQLHLPYMIRSSPERNFDYSRMTCISASREVLSRFIMFRSFNQNAFCGRTVDFFALMAGITLILAHLDRHRSSQSGGYLLAHQSLSDRAMIEQAQSNMEEVSRMNGDTLSTQSADLLRRLLSIESETANGQCTESVTLHASENEIVEPDDDSVVRVTIPYFGVVRIARKGVIYKEVTTPQVVSNVQGNHLVRGIPGNPIPENAEAAGSFDFHGLSENYLPESIAQADPDSVDGINSLAPHMAPQLLDTDSHPILQQYEYPLLTAGIDDWAFQGVDSAFFGNLMRGVEDERVGDMWTREDG